MWCVYSLFVYSFFRFVFGPAKGAFDPVGVMCFFWWYNG